MTDLSCLEDLDAFGAELDDPLAELEQDVFHMLIERPGENIDDPERGIGILDALSGIYDPAIATRIDEGLRRDDRISTSTTTITPDTTTGTYRIEIELDVDGDVLGLTYDFDGNVLRKVTT